MTMSSGPSRNELQQLMGDMVTVERHMERLLERQLPEVAANRNVAEAVGRFHQMVRSQREALEQRLESIEGKESSFPTRIAPAPYAVAQEVYHEGSAQAVSTALHTLYTAFNHAALGYTMLHAVATRFFDSQAEGNTADLARHICAAMLRLPRRSTKQSPMRWSGSRASEVKSASAYVPRAIWAYACVRPTAPAP